MINLRLILLALSAILMSAQAISAQPAPKADPSIQQIKADVQKLLSEYKALEKVYLNKQQELNAATKKITAYQQQLRETEGVVSEDRKNFNAQEAKVLALKNEIRALDNEILLKKNKNAFLRGELIDFDEQMKLHKLKLADLQFAKRQAEMEVAALRHDYENRSQAQTVRRDNLNTALTAALEKEKALTADIQQLQGENEAFETQIADLKAANEKMREDIAIGEKDKKVAEQELKLVESKIALETKSFDMETAKRARDQSAVDNKLNALQGQYDLLDSEIGKSLSAKEEKIRLTEAIVELDKTNQELKKKDLGYARYIKADR